LRYTLPAVSLGTIPAAHALSALARQKGGRVVLNLVFAAVGVFSFLQVKILTEEHTVNQAFRWVEGHLPPGSSLIKGWPEIPVLNPERFRITNYYTQNRMVDFKDFFLKQGQPFLPNYVLLDNLSFEFPLDFLKTLNQKYNLVAQFQSRPRFWKFAIPEWHSPHDWKYTHPEIRIYRRK
jgi:hypothetical protein